MITTILRWVAGIGFTVCVGFGILVGALYLFSKMKKKNIDGELIKSLKDLEKDWKHYKKKSIVVRATEVVEEEVLIKTREGILKGYKGDFIIRGIEGEIYPCGKEIFFKTYEEVKC